MPKVRKTKSGPKEAAVGNGSGTESELRIKGRRLRLYFSNERLEKLEYIASQTEANRPRTLLCSGRDGSGQFRWCGYSRAFVVVLLLAKTSLSENPKVLGKKGNSAVSSFLDVYDNGNNAFNNYPLFKSENTALPESATLNQVFYSNKGNDKKRAWARGNSDFNIETSIRGAPNAAQSRW